MRETARQGGPWLDYIGRIPAFRGAAEE